MLPSIPGSGRLEAALVNLNGNSHLLHWGIVQITVANLIVVGLMVATFVAALFVPMHRRRKDGR